MKGNLAEQLKSSMMIGSKKAFPLIKQEQIEKGAVVYLTLTEDEGLVLNQGYDSRNKFITILKELPDEYIIGSLLINSDPNLKNTLIGDCQYPLKSTDYPDFLEHLSWLDCSQIFRIPKTKVLKGGYCGKLNGEDMNLIWECLQNAKTISRKDKIRYGILDK